MACWPRAAGPRPGEEAGIPAQARTPPGRDTVRNGAVGETMIKVQRNYKRCSGQKFALSRFRCPIPPRTVTGEPDGPHLGAGVRLDGDLQAVLGQALGQPLAPLYDGDGASRGR